MKKLALNVQVNAFTTETPLAGRGTVQGHYGPRHTHETIYVGSRPPDTCYISCPVVRTCHGMAR